MNRFEYIQAQLISNESNIRRDRGIRLYDGEVRTIYEGGEVTLTTHRIIYKTTDDVSFALQLRSIIFFEEEIPGALFFTRSKKVILHLAEPPSDKLTGPVNTSIHNYIKLSFKEGFDPLFVIHLSDVLTKRLWEMDPCVVPCTSIQSLDKSTFKSLPPIKPRTGIIGIERSLQEQQRATDESINVAFQDLKKLMGMAKDMVSITKTISAKIRERQGDITEDETVRFKSYLMSLGIDDPVTRDAYKSSNEYFRQLARQLAEILEEPIKEVGGMMVLTDIYCRVNRARGLELLSPEDLLNACRQLASMNLPIILRRFDSGVMVLQSQTHSDYEITETVAQLIKNKGSVTATELAQTEGIPVVLACERLLMTEKYGKACRDDSIEALRFYPNLFLEKDT
ncbi:PREDICTED: vacuolar protein-sorting-associated protein 36 isoform X2 [Ceratosolen solmsi marchali]|uniref:Vacuolar protein-sorting-associated protein 36 n=1 Tax=Ceratosolen solmsi marchali TaxID=326594 RepID=A0AAJ6YJM0_9HYME|nr:PREDICTED: vacuolar protein-sorting-associated protein 36 isoform X2 [Ceratosolen solmsi marchali]